MCLKIGLNKKNKKKLSLYWTDIYGGSQRFAIFEKRQKDETSFWGVVTLHCQTTKVIGQRRRLRRQQTTEEATPVNGQRSTDNGLAIRSDAVDDDNGKAALTTDNGQRTMVRLRLSTDNRLQTTVNGQRTCRAE